jgi:hypothetical protein
MAFPHCRFRRQIKVDIDSQYVSHLEAPKALN